MAVSAPQPFHHHQCNNHVLSIDLSQHAYKEELWPKQYQINCSTNALPFVTNTFLINFAEQQ
jgi:hypothetical protein